jgi:Tol biopolymer transport system component/tRNA A-37 threonylcarbamoyl transferase component Bud32
MPLEAGSKLGHYEIVSSLGAGGMGEVYRARDTKLGREVAIKLLLEEVSSDPERLARFDREARVLASLNHPNIATLHGFEADGDTSFLVMEMVDGETLAEQIARGPIPVGDALALFIEIAEGLEAAHERGVVHRDLKPANIKVGRDGGVKILDFGLAKAIAAETEEAYAPVTSLSPTLTLAATQRGEILGTAAYMSPEQASGKVVDKRTDIWAFGVCLYEALTGRRAFQADDAPNTLAAVLRDEVDYDPLPPQIPLTARRLIEKTLVRDRRERLRDIGDARIDLQDALQGPAAARGELQGAQAGRLVRVGALAGVLGLALGAGVVAWLGREDPSSRGPQGETTRLTIPLPEGQRLLPNRGAPLALSRDGTKLVYAAQTNNETHLFLRSLNSFETELLEGTRDALYPFFSPDGEWIGFFVNQELRRVPVTGGAATTIASIGAAGSGIGGSWGGLWQVAADGGEPERLTEPDFGDRGYGHVWPQHLSDGEHVLFTVWGTGAGAAVLSLASGDWTLVAPGHFAARYTASSHFLYHVMDKSPPLLAAALDPLAPTAAGRSAPVLGNVHMATLNSMHTFSWAENGTVVYVPEHDSPPALYRVDLQGRATALDVDLPGFPVWLRLSPDGRRVVFASTRELRTGDLWVLDLNRKTVLPIVTEPDSENSWPVWSSDGTRVVFSSNRTGSWDLFAVDAAGGEEARPLLQDRSEKQASDWSPDGTMVAFQKLSPATGHDIWLLPIGAEGEAGEPEVFLATPANEAGMTFSPDGAWVLYVSDASERREVYLRRFPEGDGRVQISREGGTEPRWDHDGQRIFYRRGDLMFAVEFAPGGRVGEERVLFDVPYELSNPYNFGANYDLQPSGEGFFMVGDTSGKEIRVVIDWFRELERLVPTN